MNSKFAVILGVAALVAAPSVSGAAPMVPEINQPSTITLVAGGCGPNAWRGPWAAAAARLTTAACRTAITKSALSPATRARPVTGADPGAIAATRPITAVCPTAAGSNRRGGRW
jgi:hypothetical protein